MPANPNYVNRRLRVYRIPYQELECLIDYPSIVERTESPDGNFALMRVPSRLSLPADAAIHNVYPNPPAECLDLLVSSREFDSVPCGGIAPPSLVDEFPTKLVAAIDPEYLGELTQKAKEWDAIKDYFNLIREKADRWDLFIGNLPPRKHSPAFRWVFRWDSILWLYRLCRFTYEVGERGQKGWHAVQWTLGLVPTFYKFRREYNSWILRILGLRIHRKVSYGGRPD